MNSADLRTKLLWAQLWATGKCRVNKENEKILKEYARYQYLSAEGKRVLKRGYEAFTTSDGKSKITDWLNEFWPGFETKIAELQKDPDFDFSVRAYERARIKRTENPIPPQRDPGKFANKKTISAIFGIHSKDDILKNLTTASSYFQKERQIVADNPLRLRAPLGMDLVLENNDRIPIGAETSQRHECILSERVLARLASFGGTLPKAILTVENPAALTDLPRPEPLLILLVPGWNLPLGMQFLKALPAEIPMWHFSDFDPEGYEIFQTLHQKMDRQVEWFIPSFAEDYLYKAELRDERKIWKEFGDNMEIPPFVLKLQEMKSWIEQEVFCLDERMLSDLEKICSNRPSPLFRSWPRSPAG